eukprot:scaffold4174_cov122-Isochrysis_galbana.AAC.6
MRARVGVAGGKVVKTTEAQKRAGAGRGGNTVEGTRVGRCGCFGGRMSGRNDRVVGASHGGRAPIPATLSFGGLAKAR